jgi:type I restriction enzyme, S subunit
MRTRIRLDRVAPEERRVVEPASLGSDSVFLYSIPAFDEDLDGRLEEAATIGSGKVLLSGGEILISKLNPRKSRVLRSVMHEVPTLCSTEFVVLRPKAIEARFLGYLLQTDTFRQNLEARTQSVTRSQQRVSPEDVMKTWVTLPDRREQGLIADFLDRETARIDSWIAAKRRMIELTSEKQSGLFVRCLADRGFAFPLQLDPDWKQVPIPSNWRVIRLSQCLAQLTNGYVGPTRDILRDKGIRYVQSLHIKNGQIDFSRRPFFVEEAWHRERPRIHLRPGDVLIVQTGDIGQVAVVPQGFGEASCHALQIARVRADVLSGEFLGAYLRSPFGYESLLSRATGALHPHLEGSIRDVPVVVPPLSTQGEVLRELASRTRPLESLRRTLERQTDLLEERRQALITAAITGEQVIAGVAA